MKKHRLGGILLGVSLTLLLAGGVALAASASVDKACFQCIPLDYQTHPGDIPYDPYLFTVSGSGWAYPGPTVDANFYFGSGKITVD